MPGLDQRFVRNRLLRAMTSEDYARLGPHLRRMAAAVNSVQIAPQTPMERLFFPESGFTSMTTAGRGRLEIGMIGREGLVGMAVLMADDQSPYEHFTQALATS